MPTNDKRSSKMIVKLGAVALLSAMGVSAAAFLHGAGSAPAPGASQPVRTQDASQPAGAQPAVPAPAPASVPASRPAAALLPARLLDCTLGRIANFDASRIQAPEEYVFDGKHAFKLFLPAIPVRTTPPPSATDPAEPVDPQTRIVADPDGLAREADSRAFDRVVDIWPERVEMTTPVSDVASNLIVIDRIDPIRGRASLFMTKANDAVTFDLKHLYFGHCRVTSGTAAQAASL